MWANSVWGFAGFAVAFLLATPAVDPRWRLHSLGVAVACGATSAILLVWPLVTMMINSHPLTMTANFSYGHVDERGSTAVDVSYLLSNNNDDDLILNSIPVAAVVAKRRDPRAATEPLRDGGLDIIPYDINACYDAKPGDISVLESLSNRNQNQADIGNGRYYVVIWPAEILRDGSVSRPPFIISAHKTLSLEENYELKTVHRENGEVLLICPGLDIRNNVGNERLLAFCRGAVLAAQGPITMYGRITRPAIIQRNKSYDNCRVE